MKGYCTDIYFDAAMGFIESAVKENDPFFTYIATNAPHGPYHDVPEALSGSISRSISGRSVHKNLNPAA